MLQTRWADGRARGLLRFPGATRGGWSGAGLQPQNLHRPELLKTDEAIAEAIEMVRAEDYTALKDRYGDVPGVIGDLCRSMIVPAPGRRFIVGDFSAIEARVLAFLAGDADKLEAFRQFDLGPGRDIYCVTAEQVLGLSGLHSKSPERQLGKIFELGLGYSMGADRLLGHGAPGTHASSHTGRSSMRQRVRRCAILECLSLVETSASRCTTTCFRCACRPGGSSATPPRPSNRGTSANS